MKLKDVIRITTRLSNTNYNITAKTAWQEHDILTNCLKYSITGNKE